MVNYKYKIDEEKYNTSLDVWEIIKPNKQGIYEGVCESYRRTLKNIDKQFKDYPYYETTSKAIAQEVDKKDILEGDK